MAGSLSVAMLSWEFPPRIVGGISPHVYHLSQALARKGVEVHVITCDFPGAPAREEVGGARVYRIDSYYTPAPDFASWVYLMNLNLQREGATILSELSPDLVHAHDWVVATAAIGLKHALGVPLVATIHATEVGRRGGFLASTQERMIHETEIWLASEAQRILCCSRYMADQVARELFVPREKIRIIRNGVNVDDFRLDFDRRAFRDRFALPYEKLILFVGRLVYEKGAQVLIGALPEILSSVNAKLVIVGDGYFKERLLDQARSIGLAHKVYLTGFLDDLTLRKLYLCADVCVVPSLYEPFGITALEAMAARVPLVVSDVGGLSEIVDHGRTGLKVPPNDPHALAQAVVRLLTDPGYARSLADEAYREVLERYRWDAIAEEVKGIYEEVVNEFGKKS